MKLFVWLLLYDLILKIDLDTAKIYLKTETKVPSQFRTGIEPGTSWFQSEDYTH